MNESLHTLKDIEDITGMTFKTIKKKIGELKPIKVDGSKHFYDTRELLPILYVSSFSEELSLEQERAKLAASQRERNDLIIQQMKNEVVVAKDLQTSLEKTFTAVKAKMLALPSRVSQSLVGLEREDAEEIIKDGILEALDELNSFSLDVKYEQRTPAHN